MSKSLIAGAVLIITVVTAPQALAQGKHRLGLLIGVPTTIGLDWELSDRIALRPDFTVTTTSRDSSGNATSSRSWTVGAGLSAVFYVRQWDALRMYVSPRFSHTLNRMRPSTMTTSAGIGSVGAQYELGQRFSIFAEAGVGYSHSRTRTETVVFSSDTVAGRSAVGAILFF